MEILKNLFLQHLNLILLVGIPLIIIIIYSLLPRKKWRVKKSKILLEKLKEKFIDKEQYAQLMGYLRKIDPFLFEELILTVIEKDKLKIKRNKRYTGDGGIDGKFYIGRQLYLVQAKRYKNHINLQHVKDFIEVCDKYKAKGVFIHTGKTGGGVKSHLLDNPTLKIISGSNLLEFILQKKSILKILENKKAT